MVEVEGGEKKMIVSLSVSLWSIFLLSNRCGMTQPSVGGASTIQVVLGHARKQAEQATGTAFLPGLFFSSYLQASALASLDDG